jgi:hypothetical protein
MFLRDCGRKSAAQVFALEETHQIRDPNIDAREGYKAQYHLAAWTGEFAASDAVSMFKIV